MKDHLNKPWRIVRKRGVTYIYAGKAEVCRVAIGLDEAAHLICAAPGLFIELNKLVHSTGARAAIAQAQAGFE